MRYILIALLAMSFVACKNEPQTATSTENETVGTSEVKPNEEPKPKGKKNILFFGNSLTAAYGLNKSQGFPALIQEKINEKGWNYKAINAGNSGETTFGGIERVDWILEQPLDVFVLELGANDGLRGLDLDKTYANLQGIIDKVRQKHPDAEIVLAGMMAPPNMGGAYTTKFKNIYTRLAKNNDIPLIPFLLEDVAGIKSLNLKDGIHPNVEGQKIVAENVWDILENVLEKREKLG